MALQSDHEFAPTEIARAVFPTAFRGFDQDAVRRYLSRLAAALEHQQIFDDLGDLEARTSAHDRVEELETEVATLQDEIRELETELVQRSVDEADQGSRRTAEVVEFDETRAIELLGQETARVLESARSAAADILKRAENQAAGLKSDAKKELAEARREAKRLVADKQAEAEAAIDELTDEAERNANRVAAEADEHRTAVLEESAKILADAETQAAAEQTGAQARARQIVADAEALRHQVVAELVADRRGAQADLDRLVEARDRLTMSLALARSELDHLADELAEPTPTGGADEGSSVEVDGDEVARLIERLDADVPAAAQPVDDEADLDRDDAGSNPGPRTTSSDGSAGEAPAADASPKANGSGRKRNGRGAPAERRGAGGGSGGAAKAGNGSSTAGRRSTVDEPTQEMPAVPVPAIEPDDLDDVGRRPAGAEDRAGDGADDVDASAGVFDLGEPASGGEAPLMDLRNGSGAATGSAELAKGADEDRVDAAPASADVFNAAPADGAPLSLVEGFSTIVIDGDSAVDAAVTGPALGNGRARIDDDHADSRRAADLAASGLLVEEPTDPAQVVTTVAARLDGRSANRTQGDLVVDEPYLDRLPAVFGARDVAITRSGANLRRQLRRALNDDQSDVLDRLRSGRGAIGVDELQPPADQIEHYLAPLRRGLTDIAVAGARAGGGEVATESLDNLVDQMAAFIVERVRTPTVVAIEEADHQDRERILEPVRSGYRDFRNIGLPDLVEDALHEAFAVGLYDSIDAGAPVVWDIDPRTDPDPVCEVNRDRDGLVKGEAFPSGHVRPLSVPGCRCLVVGTD